MNRCHIPELNRTGENPPPRLPVRSFSRDTSNRILVVLVVSFGILNTLIGAVLILLYGDYGQ